jgi:predicted nucleotidyltransferase component of viral defense system
MARRQLTASDAFELRQALHVATLDALVSSRRWESGTLVFQGGTSLHLAHGSPRFSEDLDFLVSSSIRLDSIANTVRARLQGTAWLPADTSLSVSKAKDGRNPHTFVVTLSGPEVLGAVRVKVELWQAPADALAGIALVVAPVRLARGPAAGMQAFVPTASLSDIQADKVFALAARPYLKPRDVFDLHWLASQGGAGPCSADDMQARLAAYPNETPEAWLGKALARRSELASPDALTAIANDLRRWLPSSWPVDAASVATMAGTAVAALDHGIELMRDLCAKPGGHP